MATRLKNLVLGEVSHVDAPANQGARVLLFKAENGADPEGVRGGADTMMTDTEKIGLAARFLKLVGVGKADLDRIEGEQHMAEPADKAIEKRIADEIAKATVEKDEKIVKLEAEIAAQKAAAATDAKKAADEIAAAKSDGEKLAERLSKIEQAAEIAKTRTELAEAGVLVDLDKMVGIVVKLRATSPPDADELVKELKSGAEKAKTAALFSEIGKGGRPAPSSADAAIDAAAAELRKADPKLSEAQAMTKALKADPGLYTRHLAERG